LSRVELAELVELVGMAELVEPTELVDMISHRLIIYKSL